MQIRGDMGFFRIFCVETIRLQVPVPTEYVDGWCGQVNGSLVQNALHIETTVAF